VLTITRKIFSNTTYLLEGLLVIDLNLNQISNILKNASIGDLNIWIMDSKDQIIYHPDSEKMGVVMTDELIADDSKQKKLNIYHHSTVTQWILIAELPLAQITKNLIQLRNMTIVIGALIIGLAFAIVSGFSFSITRSLSYLQKLMKKVEAGDWNIHLLPKHKNRNDEIGVLFNSFANMVNELKRLIQVVHISKLKEKEMEIKQRESALQAMQSQINPHFLYNTLEVINSHAIMENNNTISKMTTALAHMFRYNTGNAKQIVTLKEEITHIQSYLEIQQSRYKDLQTEIIINNSLLDQLETVRLTLQPIVENAFAHGYQYHGLKPTYIGIFGDQTNDFYLLKIVDKGKGMEPKIKQDYNDAFINLDGESILENKKTFKSIGLWNVHERIRLTFGNPYGLFISKSDLSGTIIEIKLPNI
jgi:two-component system sensor histidine kinase YesM